MSYRILKTDSYIIEQNWNQTIYELIDNMIRQILIFEKR